MGVTLTPIGIVRTDSKNIPRHWSLSDIKGTLEIDPKYMRGLKDIQPGQNIVVLFHFHRSPPFDINQLVQTPPHKNKPMGLFSICSPYRPNPIGLSVLEVTGIKDNLIEVRGMDMFDGTPILDIKPHILGKQECPSYQDGEIS